MSLAPAGKLNPSHLMYVPVQPGWVVEVVNVPAPVVMLPVFTVNAAGTQSSTTASYASGLDAEFVAVSVYVTVSPVELRLVGFAVFVKPGFGCIAETTRVRVRVGQGVPSISSLESNLAVFVLFVDAAGAGGTTHGLVAQVTAAPVICAVTCTMTCLTDDVVFDHVAGNTSRPVGFVPTSVLREKPGSCVPMAPIPHPSMDFSTTPAGSVSCSAP